MPCFTPLKAYRAPGGGVAFSSKEGYADRPLDLPCGQCIGCRIQRARDWTLRCVHEAQLHERNSFITLTYSPEHLPEDGGLVVADWQDFAKRLRHKAGRFRFFHCGEYGEVNLRPHYHALLFGIDFSEDRVRYSKNDQGDWRYVSPTLDQTWGKGFASIGELTYQTAAYCARYVMKKVTGDQAEDHYRRINYETGETWRVKPEYVTMSRRPGVAADWFKRYKADVYPEDEVIHQAKRFRPPRYYDNQLDEDELNDIKYKRRGKVALRQEELTPERLRTRETHLELLAKQQQQNRKI